MSIQEDLLIDKNGDVIELVGFSDYRDEGNFIKTLKYEKQVKLLSNYAFQIVFLGLTSFRFPFAHFITRQAQASYLYTLFWGAVDKLPVYASTAVYVNMVDAFDWNKTSPFANTQVHIYTNTMETMRNHLAEEALIDDTCIACILGFDQLCRKVINMSWHTKGSIPPHPNALQYRTNLNNNVLMLRHMPLIIAFNNPQPLRFLYIEKACPHITELKPIRL
ncbi:hypothetical protein ACJMK2_026353 [Sinanodonta woodiana]|uniref:Uncharacterized protein n=1 Tax=Sinanodonta woodiana TaxID=1069815 RepID=A0ABD3XJS2_SINWO